MRVFQNYHFDLGKTVRFQDTLGFAETFLSENNYAFDRMTFDFCGLFENEAQRRKNPVTKIAKNYPALAPYYYEALDSSHSNFISNIPLVPENPGAPGPAMPGANIGIFKEIALKIPRPLAVYSCMLMPDNIHWFDEINPVPASDEIELKDDGTFSFVHSTSEHWCNTYQSNCIAVSKRFDFGTKYNPLVVKVEVTNPSDPQAILDDSSLREKLAAYFGKYHKITVCVPDEAEEKQLLIERSRIRKIIDHAFDELRNTKLPSGLLYGEKMPYAREKEKMNARKSFERIFKNTGFAYKRTAAGSCFEKTNQFHFSTMIMQGLSLYGKRLDAFLTFSGYNFQIYMMAMEQYPTTQQELDVSMGDLKFIVEYWENALFDELHASYGSTPEWYSHATHYGTHFNSSTLNAGIDMPYPDYGGGKA